MTDIPPLTAAETVRQGLRQSGIAAAYMTGVTVSNTAEDGTVQVLVDRPETAAVTDPDLVTANVPQVARCWGRYVAQDERVRLEFVGGTLSVVGSGGGDGSMGQPDILGAASIAPTTDVPVASTVATAIPLLDCEGCQVLHPNHLIRVEINIHLQSEAAANTLTGRVIRTDDEGIDTEVGRFLRSNQMGNNETIQAGVPVRDFAPEPGTYTYSFTVQAAVTGFSIILDPATSPLWAATASVEDRGPLPPGWTNT
jgi:hypothetical protein